MPTDIMLTGVTWNHTRGYVPLVATAQRFSELHPHITISWQKRSLQEFADSPIERLAERFDLLIIDHPFVGYAARHATLLPLDEYLPAEFLADQATHSVGRSYTSYTFADHQWALAVDAAAPVSAYRPDLLERLQLQLPATWDDLLALARRGLVALPAIPIDSLMNLYMLCCGLNEEPFTDADRFVSPQVGVVALEYLRELVSSCDPEFPGCNPIAVYEMMTTTDRAVYCPFAYGYVNYAREEYTQNPLRFGGLVHLNGKPLRSTLGGTGLAISAHCQQVEAAIAYTRFVAEPVCQSGLYFVSGGQPGYRQAWQSEAINGACQGFFQRTLATLDDAYVRPRYAGIIPFQEHAGQVVHHYLREGGDPRQVLDNLNILYRESVKS